MKYLVFPFLVLISAACTPPALTPAPTPRQAPVPPPEADSCGGSQYGALIGQDATALERVLIMGMVRVIRPGQAVTMDYRPERINFDIDENERIASVRCG